MDDVGNLQNVAIGYNLSSPGGLLGTQPAGSDVVPGVSLASVTKPSETVGGPVDVAVITKNEGLVWIKRKLFFDPGLNSRYLQRQAGLYK